ncbi:MAG: glycosyltransferase family 2 protein [Desulfovibrionaceae bacterium]|nr:glycosyltransferase family 2 protein [Desulfovibrionaceae bacterium]
MIHNSIVIPCYNEAASLPQLLSRLAQVFGDRDDCECLLVDNGSTDGTAGILAEAVREHGAWLRTVRVETNRGYGWGILQGLAATRGSMLGWTHADLQTDPADVLKGFALLEKQPGQYRFVKGRRYGRPWCDVLFTVGMSFFETLLFGRPLWDINAQPTLFSRSLYELWQDPPHDFALDLFAYATARKHNAQIGRFPVFFAPRRHGTSHWNVNWRAKWKFIRRTLNFSFSLKKSWN